MGDYRIELSPRVYLGTKHLDGTTTYTPKEMQEIMDYESDKSEVKNWQPQGRRKQLVDFLISKGFEFSYQYAPKQRTILIFHYDQGAYKGKNVYSRRYEEFDAYMVAGILLGEQLMMGPIENALNGVFGIGGVSVTTTKAAGEDGG